MNALDTLPAPERTAYLLDLDGTLIELAATPDAVVIPPSLPDDLYALRALAGEALAIVTGRPLADVDSLLPGVPYAVAAEHGAVIRFSPGTDPEAQPMPGMPPGWFDQAEAAVRPWPGAWVERKRHGFAVHFRSVPEAGPALEQAMRALAATNRDFAVLGAKMAWEIKPSRTDKGSAVRTLMRRRPFSGRVPVYVGDDVTDEAGIAAANALGGVGLRVQDAFGEPAAVRRWIEGLRRPGAANTGRSAVVAGEV